MREREVLSGIITDPLFYAFVIPAAIFLGLAKGGLAGVGSAATPLLSLYLPPLEAAALLLPILMCQDVISVYVYRHEWSARNLKVLIPGALIGMGTGWLFVAWVSDDAIRVLIGVISLAFLASLWLRPQSSAPSVPGVTRGIVCGALAGFASFTTQGGAPPYQIYVLPQQLPKMLYVGTTTLFFASVNAMKVVPYFMLGQFSAKNLATSAVLLPLAVLANFGGIWLVRNLPSAVFFRITYALLFIIGCTLLWQGLGHWL